MICPRCGTENRGGAAYCDSCGEPLSADAQRRRDLGDREGEDSSLLDSGGLVGWMAFDWLARFAIVGVIGFAVGIWCLSAGIYDFAVFFLGLGVVGVAGSWYMLNAK